MRFRAAVFMVAIGLMSRIGEAANIVTIGGSGQEAYSADANVAIRAAIGQPFGLVIGPDSALYVCAIANHVVRRIDLHSGSISTVAGTGKKGYAGDGGPATNARLNEPYEVRFDAGGNMFFVEMQNNLVRRVDARTKTISTVAGDGVRGFSGDGGPAVRARFNMPHSIALDSANNLYICDIGNHRIRKVDLGRATITTFCGTGERKPTPSGLPLDKTPLNGPRALDFDGHGALFLALREGNACYRIDLTAGRIANIAGTGRKGYSGDGGDPLHAALNGPKGIAVGPRGEIYLADTENHVVRVIHAGRIDTIVGDGRAGDGPDGDPRHCRMNRPHGIFADSTGTIYIGDSSNHRVRMLKAD